MKSKKEPKSFTGPLAARLRKARENVGMSQGEVARRWKYHRVTITEIENGNRHVSAWELLKFSSEYLVDPVWLLHG